MRLSLLSSLLALTFGLLAVPAQAQGKLTLYCSSDEAWCQQAKTEFEKKTGIAVDMTRKSSGETYAQIKAESANPKGDVWWGGTGDPHLQAAEENLTQAYVSPNRRRVAEFAMNQARASKDRTIGIYSGALGWGYNEELLKKQGLPAPLCWADLIKPVYKGKIQIANRLWGTEIDISEEDAPTNLAPLWSAIEARLEDRLGCQPLRAVITSISADRATLSVGSEQGVKAGDYFLVEFMANSQNAWQLMRVEQASPTASSARFMKATTGIRVNALATLLQ